MPKRKTKDSDLYGRHLAQPVNSAVQAGDGKKQPAIVMKFCLLEGPMAGRYITKFGSLHENARDYTLQEARNCGWHGDNIASMEADGFGSRNVQLNIQKRTYEGADGKKKNGLQIYVNRPPSADLNLKNALQGDELERLAAEIQAEARAIDALPEPSEEEKAEVEAARQAAEKAAQAQSDSSDDDDEDEDPDVDF